jgi:sterol desaturase/sphingolipid hydroxylase (fatty acid hydroxylase superfamily)
MPDVTVVVVLRLAMAGACVLVGFALEDTFRARRPPTVGMYMRGMWVNAVFTTLYFLADGTIGAATSFALMWVVVALPGSGFIHLPIAQHPPLWQILAWGFVWMAIIDFFFYWLHRAQHRWEWLWAIHELHHSDEHMNVTTAYRHHWLQKPLNAVAIGAPVAYLFAPPASVLLTAVLMEFAVGYFVHLNARIHFRWVAWLIASPQYHRVHHSIDPRHRDKNFAGVCPLWDVLFGSYHRAAPDEYPETGLIAGAPQSSILDANLAPFRYWRRQLRARL